VHGLPSYVIHAGALGLFPSLFLMCGKWLYWLGVCGFGFLMGKCIQWITFIKNDSARFILDYFFCFFLFLVIMSGNFDLSLALLYIKIILMFAYYLVVRVLKAFSRELRPLNVSTKARA